MHIEFYRKCNKTYRLWIAHPEHKICTIIWRPIFSGLVTYVNSVVFYLCKMIVKADYTVALKLLGTKGDTRWERTVDILSFWVSFMCFVYSKCACLVLPDCH